jgi:hypothetical protein
MKLPKFLKEFATMFHSPPAQPAKAPAASEIAPAAEETLPAKPQRSPYFQLGYKMARDSGALKLDAAYLKLLEEQVGAQAEMQGVARFDHTSNPADRRKLEALDALDEEFETRQHDCEMAAAELRKRADEVAKLGGLRPLRAPTQEFRALAAIALTISLASTLYVFFGGLFALMKWTLAIGFGFAISMMIVAAILPDDLRAADPSEQGDRSDD